MQNEVDHLCSTFYFLRNKAIASNKCQELHIFPEKNLYTYLNKRKIITHRLPPQIKFGYIPKTKGPPANPKKIITKAITFKKADTYHRVCFFPTGIIYSGTIYITDKQEKHMNALTCAVSQVSFIRTYKYTLSTNNKKNKRDSKWVSCS